MFFKKYKNLRKFKKYFTKYKRITKILIIVMFIASSLGMLLPYLVSKRLIGITNTTTDIVVVYSVLIIIIILFHHLFWYLWEKIASMLTNKVAVDIRKDIMTSFTDAKYSEIKTKTSGYYLERTNDDVIEVSSFLSNVLGTLVDSVTNISFLILIFFLNYQCGIIFTIGIIFLYVVDLVKITKDLRYTETLKQLMEKFNSKVNENYKGIRDIKGLGIKDSVIETTDVISEELAKVQMQQDKSFAFYSRIKTFSQNLLEAVLVVYAIAILVPNDGITVIVLLTIINYSGFMYDLVEYFAQMKDYFLRGDYKASRILEIISDDKKEEFGKYDKELNNYSVRINDLTYCYEDDKRRNVLNNVNFVIDNKTANVFIGSSGSGKSTLFGLIAKLLHCEDHKIFIGNKDINDLSEERFRKTICIVNQEPFLINDTILNNVRIVKENATLKEVYMACKKANIYDEIMAFEKGFDTIVRENGNNLSGGQRQRIAIARAILKDTPIILFDEPTSALDKKNQELFFETIKSLKKEKTILMIAHKLNDYKVFDNVYEVKTGNLIEIKVKV